jgi:ribulose-phosphate 3-epimerase
LALSHYFTKLHVDFIDGKFLPNRTLMPSDLRFFKSPFALIAHLMVEDPAQYFEILKQIGFAWAVIPYEAYEPVELLSVLKIADHMGLRAGISLNPQTHLHQAAKVIKRAKMIQLMGVHPGAQGRAFEPGTLDKIAELKSLTSNVIIAVDGGMKPNIAAECQKRGADWIVVGSAIMGSDHPKVALDEFRLELEKF